MSNQAGPSVPSALRQQPSATPAAAPPTFETPYRDLYPPTSLSRIRIDEGPVRDGMRRDTATSFIGRSFLYKASKQLNGPAFPDDVLAYASAAAEQYFRSLLSSAISAQNHRVTTSHTRAPPTVSTAQGKKVVSYDYDGADGDGGSGARPLWTLDITSDPSAVMDALARQSKEAEVSFRASRMDRIAREAEMTRVREAHAARLRELEGGEAPVPVVPSTPLHDSTLPSTPAATPSATPAAAAATPATPSGPPVFGAVRPSGKKAKKGPNKGNVSNDVALKMSNATAMRSAGMKMGKYSWLSGAPSVSSPLAAKRKAKRKAGEGDDTDGDADGDDADGDGDGVKSETDDNSPLFGSPRPGAAGKKGAKGKSRLSHSVTAVGPGSDSKSSTSKRKRPRIGPPARRLVRVDAVRAGAGERKVTDDKALCAVDVMFALKRERNAVGADDVVRRAGLRSGLRDRERLDGPGQTGQQGQRR